MGKMKEIVQFEKENMPDYQSKNRDHIANRELFDLFLRDKKKFLNLLFQYNDAEKMAKHIE